MEMPILKPLPLATREQGLFTRIKNWLWSPRVWELQANYRLYWLGADVPVEFLGQIWVLPKGFRTDFASSPRLFWPFGMDPQGILLIPSLFHDFGYRHGFFMAEDNPNLGAYVVWAGQDQTFFDDALMAISKKVNGMAAPGLLAKAALAVGGWLSWKEAGKYRAEAADLLSQGHEKPYILEGDFK
ncbi:MAG: DUF1353 domain-containing protein [Desulfobulbaceae bacterium]|jgi:hypothetical protein|nr:DUF1353 domain-containing protein [Desulfobulbaceae bacterium]